RLTNDVMGHPPSKCCQHPGQWPSRPCRYAAQVRLVRAYWPPCRPPILLFTLLSPRLSAGGVMLPHFIRPGGHLLIVNAPPSSAGPCHRRIKGAQQCKQLHVPLEPHLSLPSTGNSPNSTSLV